MEAWRGEDVGEALIGTQGKSADTDGRPETPVSVLSPSEIYNDIVAVGRHFSKFLKLAGGGPGKRKWAVLDVVSDREAAKLGSGRGVFAESDAARASVSVLLVTTREAVDASLGPVAASRRLI